MRHIIYSDFDGVWTDNTVLTDMLGNELVRCNKSDSLALSMFKKRVTECSLDVKIVIVTSELNICVKKRCEKLELEIMQTPLDKRVALEDHRKREAEEGVDIRTFYIGNDLNDLSAIEFCDYTFCPSDAADEVKERVDFVLDSAGGSGVIREFIVRYCKEESLGLF